MDTPRLGIAGSKRGGKAAAIFFSVIESAKRSGLNTFDYLLDILERLPSHPINRLEELLPDRWKPAMQSPAPSANSPPTSDG